MKIRVMGALAAAFWLFTAVSAAAQTWPTKPIHIIVAFPAGGSTDLATRPVADRMAQTLGQPIIVENRGGAGGNIAAEIVAKAPADGYTILASADALASNPHLYSNLNFDVLKDFAPVVQLTRQPVLLAVHPSLGVNSLAELIAAAKAKPGLAYATSGAARNSIWPRRCSPRWPESSSRTCPIAAAARRSPISSAGIRRSARSAPRR